METTSYPVRIYCPVIDAEETVYFHPMQDGAQWLVSKDSFNGCDTNFSGCDACYRCKDAAFEILKEKLGR